MASSSYIVFMKPYQTAVLSILICSTLCHAQVTDKAKLNTFSFELGKPGIIYNLSYDHRLATKNMGFRLSVGSNLTRYLNAITGSGGGYYLLGGTSHFLELGLDLQYFVVAETSDDQRGGIPYYFHPDYSIATLYSSLNLGYRKYGERTVFRIGFSPGLIESKVIPGGYIGYGLRF
jgi:hypothetical protein